MTKLQKFSVVLSTLMAATAACSLAACTNKPSDTSYGYDDDFTYYQEMVMNSEKKLYVFNRSESLSFDELVLAEAIQGIYARTDAKYYLYTSGSYETWLDDLVDNYGFTTEDITLEEMVADYIADYGNGYVLYDRETLPETVNCACSIAGVTNYLPVDKSLQSAAEGYGLELKVDASEMTEMECFSQYKDQLNNTGLVQIDNELTYMRDYGIACGYFFIWREGLDSEDLMFRGEVHDWVEENSPVFGWVPNDEAQDVTVASQYGQFVLASDYCYNMTVFACKNAFGEFSFTQPNKSTQVVAEQGKHYVCIMMSDGDNLQTWYNTFPFSSSYLAAERGDFAMGWSLSPSLSDLGQNVLNYIQRNAADSDYYVCSVSGQGYIYPQVYPDLEAYTKGLSSYLRRMDMSVVQILDSGYSASVIEAYSKIPELTGGIYCYGNKYQEGNGSVYWANDKPFVSIRESLWNADVAAMAQRINNYAKDPTSIEGYTAINLHPWSMTYQDVEELVSLLDDDVVVVTADDFIRLITENVPHVDVIR
ncbi:MAG: hypothetical protein LUD27_06470 [Clostridia bacterium]|nr:hypothetical protein [Clostridia bacterium]